MADALRSIGIISPLCEVSPKVINSIQLVAIMGDQSNSKS